MVPHTAQHCPTWGKLKLNCKNPRVSAPSTQGTYRTNRAVHWILNCKEVKCQEAKIQKFASQEAEVGKRTRDCYSEIWVCYVQWTEEGAGAGGQCRPGVL